MASQYSFDTVARECPSLEKPRCLQFSSKKTPKTQTVKESLPRLKNKLLLVLGCGVLKLHLLEVSSWYLSAFLFLDPC